MKSSLQPAALAAVVVVAAALGCDDSSSPMATPPLTGAGTMAAVTGGSAAPTAGTPAPAGSGGAGAGAGAGTVAGTDAVPTGGSGVDAGPEDAAAATDAAVAPDAGADIDAAMPEPIDLPLGAREMFPLPGATGLCNDPPLRVGFSAPPTLGSRGRVQVWSDGSLAATIDLAARVQTQNRGGRDFQQGPPVYLDGNAAVFALPPGALMRGRRYHVTIDDGVLRGPDGPFAIDDDTTWTFETASDGPGDRTKLAVGLDGKAPLCTVQAALDAVPNGNKTPTTIEIGAGSYFGLVHLQGKDNITLHGADRERTKIAGTNNNNLNPSTRTRPLFSVEGASDITIENLTIHNLTPQGGSQAEALALLPCDRCIVRDANVLSLQDTLLWTGRVYAENSLIAGNVDFIWGSGAAFFKNCEIRMVGRAGYIVQSRNGTGGYGYVFVDSRITADPEVQSAVFARIDANAYPASHVAYVDCQIGRHISAAAWEVTRGSTKVTTAVPGLRFWEYGSKDESGRPVDTSRRHAASQQLSASQAAEMRDPAIVLGGWSP